MRIKVWGSRGSIPVSGREYLRYGGDTTCLEIRTKSDDIFIVDAGTGIRRLGSQLIEDERYHLPFSDYPRPLGPPDGMAFFQTALPRSRHHSGPPVPVS